MRRAFLGYLAALALPACGGGGGGSSLPPVPSAVLSSATPSSFTQPGTTTLDFTVSGGGPSGAALVVTMAISGSELQILGDIDLDVNATGTFSRTWDGDIWFFDDGTSQGIASLKIASGTVGGEDLYTTQVQRTVFRRNTATNALTQLGPSDDVLLTIAVDPVGSTWDLSSSSTGSFPSDSAPYMIGPDQFINEDHIRVYRPVLNVTTGSTKPVVSNVNLIWQNVDLITMRAIANDYQVWVKTWNAGGTTESNDLIVTVN